MTQGEQQIIDALKQRDATAFAYLFKQYYYALCSFAERLLNDRQEAEDIVQDQLMKLWRKHADFDSLSSIKSFLYISTRNACFNFLKHSKHVSSSQKELLYLTDNKEMEVLHMMIHSEMLREVAKEIDVLPKAAKRVFELCFFDGLDSKEIAKELGLSIQTVYNEKARAVQFIRTALLKKKLLFFFSCISFF